MQPKPIMRWHEIVTDKAPAKLADLLADDVVFHSPVVHTPQVGKAITTQYLTAAMRVLGGEAFHYTRECWSGRMAVLEFETVLDGITVNGVDMIQWNEQDQITDFKVMVRPLKAINTLHHMMAQRLAAH